MEQQKLDAYGTRYKHFTESLYADIRRETYGDDFGQNSALTAGELDLFLSWLQLDTDDRLLDISCGSGGPTMRIVQLTGCQAHGIDISEDAIQTAKAEAQATGLAERATFDAVDAGQPLPFDDDSFDAIVCFDAINHLPDRAERLKDWALVLRPGGRVMFTDNIVVTGPISNEEIAIRSSIGFYLFVPPDLDDRLLDEAGFNVIQKRDLTEQIEQVMRNGREAYLAREVELREIEGDEIFDSVCEMREVGIRLSAERRLSRFAYCAQLQ